MFGIFFRENFHLNFSREKNDSKWRSNQQGRPGRGYSQLPFILFSHRCRHFHLRYFMLVYGFGFIIYYVNIRII